MDKIGTKDTSLADDGLWIGFYVIGWKSMIFF